MIIFHFSSSVFSFLKKYLLKDKESRKKGEEEGRKETSKKERNKKIKMCLSIIVSFLPINFLCLLGIRAVFFTCK